MTTATTGSSPSDTRERILDSARRLFAERGYPSTSLADIAADVGLTKTAVAYHFHPKEQLLVELVTPALTDIVTTLGPLPTATRRERRAFLGRLVEVLVRNRDVIGILASDTGLLTLPALRGTAFGGVAPRDLLLARLVPARPSPADVVRAWSAIGAAQVAVARTLDQPVDLVCRAATAAAVAAYDS